jgi:WhiB family redox-sensing transcriptional regulator
MTWTGPTERRAGRSRTGCSSKGIAQNGAKSLCLDCPVRFDCLAYALDHREEYGVWGAMPERERRALPRRRPTVTSWAEIFRSARRDTARISLPRPAEGR